MNTTTCIKPTQEAENYAEECLARFLKKYEQTGGNAEEISETARDGIYYTFLGMYMRDGKAACDDLISAWNHAPSERPAQ